MLNTNNANVPAGIQKDPINATNVKNPAAKVNKIYK
jgi:hypothetical protein